MVFSPSSLAEDLNKFKIKRTAFTSDQEKTFFEFCKSHGFDLCRKIHSHPYGVNTNTYTVSFSPELDGTEKRVLEKCEENGIGVQFARDADGFHHYQFAEFIPSEFPQGAADNVIDIRKITAKHPALEPEPLPEVELKVEIPKKTFWEKISCLFSKQARLEYQKKVDTAKEKAERQKRMEEARIQEEKNKFDFQVLAGLKKPKERQK